VSAQPPSAKVRSASPRRAHASTVCKPPSPGEAYRLSRIHAEGWNAAHRVAATALDTLDEAEIESLNPYASEPQRTRWNAGFRNALAS
jgi:hypothetical protein